MNWRVFSIQGGAPCEEDAGGFIKLNKMMLMEISEGNITWIETVNVLKMPVHIAYSLINGEKEILYIIEVVKRGRVITSYSSNIKTYYEGTKSFEKVSEAKYYVSQQFKEFCEDNNKVKINVSDKT